MTRSSKQYNDEYNRKRRGAAARSNKSLPIRIEQIVQRELERHTDHLRKKIAYSATCTTCQVQQLGKLVEHRPHAWFPRQPHYRGCE